MEEIEELASGEGEFRLPDPDAAREWIKQRRAKGLVNKVMTEQEAIARLVNDGDYMSWDLADVVRGPLSLFREIIRQKKKKLWIAHRFSYLIVAWLYAGGCVSKVDIGFIYMGRVIRKAIEEGKLKVIDWSNFAMTSRQMAGAMGIPFIPIRNLSGTDTFKTSGAKIVKDPFTGKPVCVVPALFSDVALIHVHQCDIYGNARIFGPGLDPRAVALSSQKVIISTEEIIDPEEIRMNPGKTTLPYYCVDAVVEAPYGIWPGTMPGRYSLDPEGWGEMFRALDSEEQLQEYMDKYIYSVPSHLEMLEKRVGAKRLAQNMVRERNREGYY